MPRRKKVVEVVQQEPKIDLKKKNEMFYAFWPECEKVLGHKNFHNKKLPLLDFFDDHWVGYSDIKSLVADAIKYAKTKKGAKIEDEFEREDDI